MLRESTMDMSDVILGVIALVAFLWMLREWNNAE